MPTSGPLIFAPNHFSNVDHFFLGQSTRRKVQFMSKSQLYKGWFAGVMKHGGVFPVRRGYRDEQSFEVALSILERGGTICMYCEGGRSRTGKLAERAKAGIGRVALQSGATVVPAAISGSQKVRNWKRLQFPKVDVVYGEPLRFEVVAEPDARAAAGRGGPDLRRDQGALRTAAGTTRRPGARRAPRAARPGRCLSAAAPGQLARNRCIGVA